MKAATVYFVVICAAAMAEYSPVSKSSNADYNVRPHVVVYPVHGQTITTTTTKRPTTTTKLRTYLTTTKKPIYVAPKAIDAAYVLANSPFTCNGLNDGHYADVQFDCMFFHQCEFYHKADGNLYVQQAVFECGEGTKFNQTIRTCDYADEVSCDVNTVESIIRYQLAAPKPTPGPSKAKPIPVTSFRCLPKNQNDGFYYADEETNCEVYHRCVYHVEKESVFATQYSFMCPEGTLFNQETISCLVSDHVHCASSSNLWDAQRYLHPRQ